MTRKRIGYDRVISTVEFYSKFVKTKKSHVNK